MRTGRELVDRIADIHGFDPDWVFYPASVDRGWSFSTAKFTEVQSSTVSALMPLSAAEDGHFTIEVDHAGISVTVFCDAPEAARMEHAAQED